MISLGLWSMDTACLFYYTILVESREWDPETTDTKKSSYRPCVLLKDTEQHLTNSLFKDISQQILSVCKMLFFSVRQITMTVRKFRPQTDDYTEGKSCFCCLSYVKFWISVAALKHYNYLHFLMTDLTIKIPFLYHLRLNS